MPIPSGNGTKMVPAFEVYSCNTSSLETADLTICATDGISYKNECEFSKKKCQDAKCLEEGSNCIEKMCKGKCPCSEGCPNYCPIKLIWDPHTGERTDTLYGGFCGSDNITYRSDCQFEVAKCNSLELFNIELTIQCNHVCPCRKGNYIILHL